VPYLLSESLPIKPPWRPMAFCINNNRWIETQLRFLPTLNNSTNFLLERPGVVKCTAGIPLDNDR